MPFVWLLIGHVRKIAIRSGLTMAGTLCGWVVWACLAVAPGGEPLQRFEFAAVKMGVPFRVVLYTKDEPSANDAIAAVWKKIDKLDRILSDYDPDSELSRFCQSAPHQTPLEVSQPLWEVLLRGDEIARQSDGAFDMTVGPVVRLWRQSKRSKKLPSPDRLQTALAAVGYQKLEVSPDRPQAKLIAPGMMLDLGGIAIGYTVDQTLSELRAHGVPRALVDASGDVGVGDPPPDEEGWRIGLTPPGANSPPALFLILSNAGVTTSGDMTRHVEIDGVKYSHIVNPRTGLGLTARGMATVIAKNCLRADALTKPVLVLGPEKGMTFIESQTDAACILQTVDGVTGGVRRYESTHVKDFKFVPTDKEQ
jgi:thiamine biosynthesis lipoprotein